MGNLQDELAAVGDQFDAAMREEQARHEERVRDLTSAKSMAEEMARHDSKIAAERGAKEDSE